MRKLDIAMKRHVAIDDSIKRAEEAVLLAKQRAEDDRLRQLKNAYLTASQKALRASAHPKKPDSLQYLLLSSF